MNRQTFKELYFGFLIALLLACLLSRIWVTFAYSQEIRTATGVRSTYHDYLDGTSDLKSYFEYPDGTREEIPGVLPLLAAPQPAPALGTRSLAVFRITLAGEQPACTAQELEGYLHANPQNLQAFFSEASHGQFALTPIDIYEVSFFYWTDACYWLQWAQTADAVAGIGNQYDHKMYVFPDSISQICNAGGFGDLGGPRTWIFQCHFYGAYAHEIGHNLGLHHASTDYDNDTIIDNEYGDTSCPMGFTGGSRHFNAPHKKQLGWTQPLEATQDGIYEIGPLESGAAQITATGTAHYHVSTRQTAGPQSVGLSAAYQGRASIHRDDSPQTRLVAVLNDGDSFNDGWLHISQLSTGKVMIQQTQQCQYSDIYHPQGGTWRAHWCASRDTMCWFWGVCFPRPAECDQP